MIAKLGQRNDYTNAPNVCLCQCVYMLLFVGLYSNKKMRRLHKNGALLCLPLSLDRLKDKPLDAVSKELARCLHEVHGWLFSLFTLKAGL